MVDQVPSIGRNHPKSLSRGQPEHLESVEIERQRQAHARNTSSQMLDKLCSRSYFPSCKKIIPKGYKPRPCLIVVMNMGKCSWLFLSKVQKPSISHTPQPNWPSDQDSDHLSCIRTPSRTKKAIGRNCWVKAKKEIMSKVDWACSISFAESPRPCVRVT